MLNSNQMQAKEYLKQVYRYNEMIKSNMEEIENLRTISTSIASADPSKERVNKSHHSDAPFVTAVAKLIDLEKQVDDEMVKFLELRQEVRDTINQIANVNGILILRYRYLDFMKWEDLAKKMDYSIKSVHRIHEAALNEIADILLCRKTA